MHILYYNVKKQLKEIFAMTIFAWVLMVLSGICLIFAIPSIVNSKFLVGLITLASNAATVFYFVSYLFLDI